MVRPYKWKTPSRNARSSMSQGSANVKKEETAAPFTGTRAGGAPEQICIRIMSHDPRRLLPPSQCTRAHVHSESFVVYFHYARLVTEYVLRGCEEEEKRVNRYRKSAHVVLFAMIRTTPMSKSSDSKQGRRDVFSVYRRLPPVYAGASETTVENPVAARPRTSATRSLEIANLMRLFSNIKENREGKPFIVVNNPIVVGSFYASRDHKGYTDEL
ncbi:hypothetical protein OPT61_g5935 [Boeremia exigua]|uniref:Uncharacterized protein n=1 Tax=Boeremia exigua TaxID=749465 RepID=A0ACC2I8G1_9PLEO|nr:hypothetical protein OPT61_g5935 [Boeremia exigua]